MFDWYNTNAWKLDESEAPIESYYFNELPHKIQTRLLEENSLEWLENQLFDEDGGIIL